MDTSLGRITCLLLSGLATLLKSLKICCFLFPISFYLGTFTQTGLLAFQTWVPLFLSLCGALHSGPCAVLHSSEAVQPESLLFWPHAAYGVYSTARSIYSVRSISCVCHIVNVDISKFWFSVAASAQCIFHVWLQEAWPHKQSTAPIHRLQDRRHGVGLRHQDILEQIFSYKLNAGVMSLLRHVLYKKCILYLVRTVQHIQYMLN